MTTRSYRASAFLDAAGRLRVPVTVGSDQAQALSEAHPEGSLRLDFSSPHHALPAIVRFAAEHPIGAVLAADDDGVVLAALAAQALGLPHNPPDAVRCARDKLQMRETLARAGLPSPRFEALPAGADPRAAGAAVGFPCVVKPLSLSASRGVMRADDSVGLAAAVRRLSTLLERERPAESYAGQAETDGSSRILVESFIPGVEVAVEGLLVNGVLEVLAVFDKPDALDGPFFEETIYVTPSRLPEARQRAVRACTAETARALGLTDGPVHAELRVNEDGPWPVELAPRTIGGLCARALRFGEGVSLEELVLSVALGLPVASFRRESVASGVMMVPIPRRGILRDVRGISAAREIPGLEDVLITIPIGQEVIPLPEGSRYLGFLFARAGTPAEVEDALRHAHSRLEFEIDPSPGAAGAVPG